jgi:hypothetical protein
MRMTLQNDASRLVAYHSAARDLAKRQNATEDAIRHATDVIRYAEKLDGRDAREVQAAARTELARLYLREQNRVPSLSFEAYQAYVAKAVPLFQQSVLLRQSVLADSEANHDSDGASNALQQLAIASNDVVYGLVQVSQCEQALPFTAPLAQLIPRLDKDLKLTALSLENIAAANVCAHQGNTVQTVDAAKRAVSIREQFKETTDDHRRLMVAYFTLWEAAERIGNTDVCAQAAGRFASIYETVTGQHVDPSLSTPIDGKIVSIEKCLQAYQSGEKR